MNKLNRLAINEEGFIFDPETGNSYTVNRTGFLIIKLLKEGKDEEEILKVLTENFEVTEEEARRDLMDFMEQLKIYGFLEEQNV